MRERILPLISQVGESQCTDPRVLKKVADVLKNSRGMMNHVQKCSCFMFTLIQEYEGELFYFIQRTSVLQLVVAWCCKGYWHLGLVSRQ